MKALWCLVGLVGVVLTAGAAEVPMRRVVLYTSGVGFFEHAGKVKDDDRLTLVFGADQMSDLLKSLVIRDLDGGAVGTISYPAQNSSNKVLETFPVNLAGGLSRKALLDALRGGAGSFCEQSGGGDCRCGGPSGAAAAPGGAGQLFAGRRRDCFGRP